MAARCVTLDTLRAKPNVSRSVALINDNVGPTCAHLFENIRNIQRYIFAGYSSRASRLLFLVADVRYVNRVISASYVKRDSLERNIFAPLQRGATN